MLRDTDNVKSPKLGIAGGVSPAMSPKHELNRQDFLLSKPKVTYSAKMFRAQRSVRVGSRRSDKRGHGAG